MTLLAFVLVMSHVLDRVWVIVVIVCLAFVQIVVQLYCFLHLGKESRPRWNFLILLFAILVISIVIGGSLWIMHNLNYNMSMTPQQVRTYMLNNEGL